MKGLLIVVNYEQELEISRFLQRLEESQCGLEMVLVDDGSRDRSPEIAVERGLRVLRHDKNLGVGASIRTGIKFARAEGRFDYVLIMSSNGKMYPEETQRVINPIVEGRADYVQGSRFLAGGQSPSLSGFRSMAIPLYSKLASILLGKSFTDITCGYRAYTLRIFDDQRVNLDQDWLNRYEAELYIHFYACKLGLRMVEVPVTIDYSHLAPGRKTKMRPLSGWWSLARPLVLLRLGIHR